MAIGSVILVILALPLVPASVCVTDFSLSPPSLSQSMFRAKISEMYRSDAKSPCVSMRGWLNERLAEYLWKRVRKGADAILALQTLLQRFDGDIKMRGASWSNAGYLVAWSLISSRILAKGAVDDGTAAP